MREVFPPGGSLRFFSPRVQPLASVPLAASFVAGLLTRNRPALEDVKVTLTDLSNAKPLTAHTDLTGRFTFTGLPSSKYSLTFDLEGYAVQQLRPYDVLPGIPVEVWVELKRLAPPLTRPRAGLEGIAIEYGLVREQIEAVPVLVGSEGRTPVDKLLSMVPGASPTQSLEVNPFTGRAAAVSVNGSRPSAINYQLDSGSNNAQNRITGAQAAIFGPMAEGIETFRVVSHNLFRPRRAQRRRCCFSHDSRRRQRMARSGAGVLAAARRQHHRDV